MSSHTVRAVVDPRLCIGSGTCIAVAPGLFEIGVDGTSAPVRSEIASDLMLLAAEHCPVGAIRIVDGPRTPNPDR